MPESPNPPAADPQPLPGAESRSTQTDTPLYTIKVVDSPGTLCADCGKQETGSGPVGFRDEDPICDLCLLESDPQLGMMLALVAVVRAYANEEGTPEEWYVALKELGAFARIYDCFAAKSGPARILKIFPDSSGHNDVMP